MKIVVKPVVCAVLSIAVIGVPAWGRDASGDAVRQGLKYQSKGQYAPAIEAFTRAIHLQPRNINAYLARGDAYREMQSDQQAIGDYEFLIDQYGVADAYYGRGMVYVRQNKGDQALADFTRAIEISSLPAGSLPELNGGKKLTPGDFEAYMVWKRAADARDSEEDHKKNTAALAYVARGRVYLDQKQFDAAISNFSSALYKDRKLVAAYVGLAEGNYGLKKYSEAIFDYNFAVLMQPKTASLYHDRGVVYLNAGSNEKAIADFEMCLKLDPTAADAANTRALLAAAKTPAIPITPTTSAAKTETAQEAYGRGEGFRDAKDFDKALAAYSDAIRLKPDYAFAFKARADTYRALKQPCKALADYDAAIRLYPEIAGAASSREEAVGEIKQQEETIAQNSEAIRRRPKDPDAYVERGLNYFEQGQNDRALADFTIALQLRPDDFKATSYRAAVYIALKQYDRALADLESAKKMLKDPDEIKNLQEIIDETKQEAAKTP